MSAIEALPPQQGGPPREGTRPADAVSAWRQVFDREQIAAQDKFRSVQAPAFPAASASASARLASRAMGGSSRLAPPATAVASGLAGPGGPAASTGGFTRAALQAAGTAGPPSPPRGFPGQVPASLSLPAARTGQPASITDGARGAPLAGLLEKWPWRKVHCMISGDGLHLWLRDAGATPHDPALQRWLTELQRTLAATGISLASFTLNGRTCPVPSIVS